jgi:hypothetical protein
VADHSVPLLRRLRAKSQTDGSRSASTTGMGDVDVRPVGEEVPNRGVNRSKVNFALERSPGFPEKVTKNRGQGKCHWTEIDIVTIRGGDAHLPTCYSVGLNDDDVMPKVS